MTRFKKGDKVRIRSYAAMQRVRLNVTAQLKQLAQQVVTIQSIDYPGAYIITDPRYEDVAIPDVSIEGLAYTYGDVVLTHSPRMGWHEMIFIAFADGAPNPYICAKPEEFSRAGSFTIYPRTVARPLPPLKNKLATIQAMMQQLSNRPLSRMEQCRVDSMINGLKEMTCNEE